MMGQLSPYPGEFATEIAIMKDMGWSWGELMGAPYPVVLEIAQRMDAEARWQREKRALDEAMTNG